jgi:hypothetical protein
MDLSPIFNAVLVSKNEGAALCAANLKTGDRLTGRVLSLDADGRALIDLGRFRATAQMGFSVQPGQTLNLQVIHSGTPLHLRVDVQTASQTPVGLPQLNFTQVLSASDQQQWVDLLNRMTASSKADAALHPMPERIQQALVHIKAVFDPIPIHKSMAQLAQWLRGAVEDRGTLFEKKMADALLAASQSSGGSSSPDTDQVRAVIAGDLKPHLLMLKAFTGELGIQKQLLELLSGKELEFVRHGVEKLLDHVVLQQERVVSNWREGDSFQIFTHMLPIEEQKLPVQFKIYYPRKAAREKGDPHQQIALLLHMDRLGPVRADLAMAGRHLKIQFFVKTDAVRQRFEQQGAAVATALKGVFDDVVIATRVSEEKIVQFNQQGQRGVSLGRIDIQV